MQITLPSDNKKEPGVPKEGSAKSECLNSSEQLQLCTLNKHANHSPFWWSVKTLMTFMTEECAVVHVSNVRCSVYVIWTWMHIALPSDNQNKPGDPLKGGECRVWRFKQQWTALIMQVEQTCKSLSKLMVSKDPNGPLEGGECRMCRFKQQWAALSIQVEQTCKSLSLLMVIKDPNDPLEGKANGDLSFKLQWAELTCTSLTLSLEGRWGACSPSGGRGAVISMFGMWKSTPLVVVVKLWIPHCSAEAKRH